MKSCRAKCSEKPCIGSEFLLMRIWKPALDSRSTNKRAFIISEKVNGIVKANTNSLKNTTLIIDSGKTKQNKTIINKRAIKNIFLKV